MTGRTGGVWPVDVITGPPGVLHARPLGGPGRAITVCRATSPALVLGSAQPAGTMDAEAAAAAGLDVTRRRSGGGAVLVVPGRMLWVDVTVPAADPVWEDDIEAAARRVGGVWAAALAQAGVAGAVSHAGGMVRTEWSGRLCFAGLGPGEVTVDGRKLVGISQRRTRDGATFQAALPLSGDDQARAARLLAVAPADRCRAEAAVRASTATLDAWSRDPAEAAHGLVAALAAGLADA